MMKTCPNCGKRVDSSWLKCPYCKQEREAKVKLAPEVNLKVAPELSKPRWLPAQFAKSKSGTPDAPVEEKQQMPERDARNPTRVEQSPSRRETRYQNLTDQPASNVKPDPIDNRKIVGVLASYTWRAEGQLFPVREGRTHIGAGSIKSDPEHRQVEVFCPLDEQLSADHAEILVQAKKFWIRDLSSVNGTYVNGSPDPIMPESPVELTNNSEIRAGKTIFTFVKIEPRSEPKTEKPVTSSVSFDGEEYSQDDPHRTRLPR
jgi:hypothetical protein